MDDKPTLSFASKELFRAWLDEHNADTKGIWLRFAKKGSGIQSVSYADAVLVALCYGWIDGQAKSLDDREYLQKFTPRAKRSMWSKRNTEKVKALIESGEMHRSGIAEVERAKADGRWDAAYESPATATIPDDLISQLALSPMASHNFEALDSQNRYAILFRIHNAKKPETRAKRISEFVAMLERGEKVHP